MLFSNQSLEEAGINHINKLSGKIAFFNVDSSKINKDTLHETDEIIFFDEIKTPRSGTNCPCGIILNEVSNMPDNNGDIIIYQSENGNTKIDVRFVDETVWLTQQQMAELFQSSRTNVVEHIQHIYEEGELDETSTCRKFRQVRTEGNRQVTREIPYYNLDMIISLGYRVKSIIATNFRRWATEMFSPIPAK